MTAAPELEISGEESLDFVFREDFSPTRAISVEINQVIGELVWVEDYSALEFGETLSNTIVVRPGTPEIDFEIEQAKNHGVVGIIFTGNAHDDQVFAKQPETIAYSLDSPIPVFELTQSGTRKLLEVTGNINQGFTKLPPVSYLGVDGDMAFRLPAAESLSTANVLGLLPGSDPFLKHEVIIIGAHYDHVGDDPSNGLKYSGGNDDASGISGLLEIARIWHQAGYHPKRSVLFAAWGAQESGQAGSSYYVENPIFPLGDIIGVIQMDGIAGGDGFYPGIQGEWARDGQLLFRLRTEDKWIITPQITPSDHFAFHDHPIPTLLVSWRLANEDNLPDDFADQVSPEKIEVCVKMVILILMGVSR
jgi:Zn-dependent M28 family amino/carboxypeptidase